MIFHDFFSDFQLFPMLLANQFLYLVELTNPYLMYTYTYVHMYVCMNVYWICNSFILTFLCIFLILIIGRMYLARLLFMYFNTLFNIYEGNQIHQLGKKPNFWGLHIFWQDHLPGMQSHIHYSAENYRYVWRHLGINGYILNFKTGKKRC